MTESRGPGRPPNTVKVECICSPDVHLGDGRVLMGPQKEGTKTIVHGQVAEVTPALAKLLIDNGQAKETDRPVTVRIEDTAQYTIEQAEAALRARRG